MSLPTGAAANVSASLAAVRALPLGVYELSHDALGRRQLGPLGEAVAAERVREDDTRVDARDRALW